ncbi:LOW QUALITY PROTEIN: olfactory receptor 1019-like [Gopherus evgoodei]|uniref:LOW QUALITY PROTEIN: olfactory receptor 1019-like n=1 Tax=Gopherus evgoodei TaxID=1825980 RepID=UPI0011CF8E15|nr:LOW QUALITY PROTEIN: olfactory receptor 1019-like [Gopherus evgoodei]
MYFFLLNLSFVDICYFSAIAPKALQNLLAERKTIAYAACAAHMLFFNTILTTECYLLVVMVYDQYVAICKPLFYVIIMSPKICAQLVAGSYLIEVIGALVQTSGAFRLSYCSSNIITHLFCDIPAVVKLSCSGTYNSELMLFAVSGIIAISTISIILLSSIYILSTILRIRSTQGRAKTFSTCTSHLMAITMFYGMAICIYVLPQSED